MTMDPFARVITHPVLLRIVWQIDPGIATCALFWVAAMRFAIGEIRREHLPVSCWLGRLSFVGLLLNATVTLANGGFMPVVGGHAGLSLWVTATDGSHLLWLADQGTWWGFSLGDGLIIGGWLARLMCWIGRTVKAAWGDDRLTEGKGALP